MTTFTPSYEGERPSFKHITLYQLCYWKVTRIYGLTKEEIEDLITNPDPHIPSPHQVYPGILLAYFTRERIYGLTEEEINSLLRNPDLHIPSHHQVDPRIIKAYLTGESVPTYLPGHRLPRYFGIRPGYLPRDRFIPSEQCN